jgi:hypothetical protein
MEKSLLQTGCPQQNHDENFHLEVMDDDWDNNVAVGEKI